MFNKKFFYLFLFIYIIILNAVYSIRINKEIGGSLLDLIKKPEEEISFKNSNQKNEIFNLIEKSNNNLNNIFLSLGENNNESESANTFEIEKKDDNKTNTVANYEIKSPNNKLIHSAYSDSYKSRKWGLVTLILFGTTFLILRSGYNFLKNINKFFAKGVKSLSNQFLFFLFL